MACVSGVSLALLVIMFADLMNMSKQLNTLKTDVSQSTPASDASQLTALQNSVSNLSSKMNQPSLMSLNSTTCTGTLSEDLSGSATQVGYSTNMDLSGDTPVDLTCRSL